MDGPIVAAVEQRRHLKLAYYAGNRAGVVISRCAALFR